MGGWAPRCETRATGKPASAESLQRVTRSRRAAADGDWEDLDARLDRLVLEPSPAAAAAARRAHRTPPARPRQPPPAPAAAAPRSNGRAGTPPPADGGLVFDGAHVLEAHGLTSATTSTQLEAWLESLDLWPLGPVLRRALARPPQALQPVAYPEQAVAVCALTWESMGGRASARPCQPAPGLLSVRGAQVGQRGLRAGSICDARRRAGGARACARVRVPVAQLCAGAPYPAGFPASATRCLTVGWHSRTARV